MSIQTKQVNPEELYKPPYGIVIRAGVIPFTRRDDKRYYLMGLFGDDVYTDMGGGCKTSRHERPIDCLLREIEEETDSKTAQVIINTLQEEISLGSNPRIEVWRQSAKYFKDYGYPFPQRRPGPIYRYYVLLEIDDPEMKLGGPTLKEEVNSYQWIDEKMMKTLPKEKFNRSCQDFLLLRQLINQE